LVIPQTFAAQQKMATKKMQEIIFEGIFKPPVIGNDHIPIKITGSGACEVTLDGLKIQGYRQKNRVKSSILFISFFGLFFGLALIQGVLKIEIPKVLWGLPFSVFIIPFISGSGNDHQGESIQLLIPWDKVSHAKFYKGLMCVGILIKKFRHQNEPYQGELFFAPSDATHGVESFLIALRAQGVKC
jgi:hypothetical protein